MFSFLLGGLLFAGVALGVGWPLFARSKLDPAEKIAASVSGSLLISFLGAWAVYAFRAPLALHWLVPGAALAGLAGRWPEFRATWADTAARELVLGQCLVTVGCLALLALVTTYSGGGWTGDWFEHWERAKFFLERQPIDTVFIGHAAVTARPPLANVVTALFLSLTRADFAHYQMFSAVLATLAFLPAALLARRFGSARSIAILAVLLLANPLFVQNATFAWTKLPTAFFVLGAISFFLRLNDDGLSTIRTLLLSVCLAGGVLTHYSAAPYVVVLAFAWLVLGFRRRLDLRWWRTTIFAVSSGTALLATWFGWAIAHYGTKTTLAANTSVQAADTHLGGQLVRIALNIRDTLVPHFLRSVDSTLIVQNGPWVALRDGWFQLYQVNLVFAFGSVASCVIALLLVREWRDARRIVRLGWLAAIVGVIALGIGVHGARDTWGLAHICLQPLVLLGLAFLAARWPVVSPLGKIALLAGAALDIIFGIALHFAVQNLAFERWAGPSAFVDWQANNSDAAVMNYAAKLQHRLAFFGDVLRVPPALVVAGLLLLLVTALRRTRAVRGEISKQP